MLLLCSGWGWRARVLTLDPLCWVWSRLVVCWQTIPSQNDVHGESERRQPLRLQAPPEEDVPKKEAHQALLSPAAAAAAASPELSPFWLVAGSNGNISRFSIPYITSMNWRPDGPQMCRMHGENEWVLRVSHRHRVHLVVLNLLFPTKVVQQRFSSPASHGARITLLYNLLVFIF